jgi:VanZ family protein
MADLPTAARLRPWAPLFRLAFAVTVLTVIGLSLLPGRDLPQVGLSDKLEHVIAYAGMALTGGLAFPRGSAVLRLAILLPLLGIALEFCQLLVPGRSAEVADAVADTIGVLLVVLPFLVLRRVLVRRGG